MRMMPLTKAVKLEMWNGLNQDPATWIEPGGWFPV